MYEKIIENYIQTMTREDIQNFARGKNIPLNQSDTDIIYDCAKKNWKVFYKEDPTPLLKELEKKLDPVTFNKLKQLYIETKSKFSL